MLGTLSTKMRPSLTSKSLIALISTNSCKASFRLSRRNRENMEHVRYFLQFSGEADCHLAGIRRRGAGARVVPRASPVRTSVSWTSGRIRAHAKLSMSTVISSTGSCHVKLANPGTALILEHQCWHDQGHTHEEKIALSPQSGSHTRGENGSFTSKFCQQPPRRPGFGIRTALLSENGRRIGLLVMPSRVNRKAAIYLPRMVLRSCYLR